MVGICNWSRLRFPGLGVLPGQRKLSFVIDERGIGGSAAEPSGIEALAAAEHLPSQRERARALMALWRDGRISETNDGREETEPLPARYVLVIDQPVDPAGLSGAIAQGSSFQAMLDAACAAHPECAILILAARGGKTGYLARARLARRAHLITGDPHPVSLLERAEAVYTVSSQLGFEALLWKKPVHTFGVPYYAGWGLTLDALPAPARRDPVPLEDLVHAALVERSGYRHPETGAACEVEEVIAWLALQRRMRERFPATLYAAGFSLRKRRFVRSFLQGSKVHFIRDASVAPAGVPVVTWGRGREGSKIRIEDGFLRSVGLGAGLVRPLSWVLDRRGIYYDATSPSEMEQLLATTEFDAALLERAARLREALVAGGVTKYNLDVHPWQRPANASRVILVPGQVENDASLRYGAPGIRTNLDLLKAVRAANPTSFIVYKPHPDVVAGLRSGGKGEEEAPHWCNQRVTAAPMGQLLLEVDEVHVLTSLAGFEALLRGKSVTCHGQPFYAGWGLTTDMAPITRRTRRLSLDALVAVALILYPTYISRVTGCFTTPERIIEELRQWRTESDRRHPTRVQRAVSRLFNELLRRIEEPSRRTGAS